MDNLFTSAGFVIFEEGEDLNDYINYQKPGGEIISIWEVVGNDVYIDVWSNDYIITNEIGESLIRFKTPEEAVSYVQLIYS